MNDTSSSYCFFDSGLAPLSYSSISSIKSSTFISSYKYFLEKSLFISLYYQSINNSTCSFSTPQFFWSSFSIKRILLLHHPLLPNLPLHPCSYLIHLLLLLHSLLNLNHLSLNLLFLDLHYSFHFH